jgi:hypothetical protein
LAFLPFYVLSLGKPPNVDASAVIVVVFAGVLVGSFVLSIIVAERAK